MDTVGLEHQRVGSIQFGPALGHPYVPTPYDPSYWQSTPTPTAKEALDIEKLKEILIPAPAPKSDPVNHPKHYTNHPSGIEAIQVTEHMGFNLGNAVKYIWRCDLKKDAIEDLKKAVWYIEREISKRTKATAV
jgi:hypothetical protein